MLKIFYSHFERFEPQFLKIKLIKARLAQRLPSPLWIQLKTYLHNLIFFGWGEVFLEYVN